MYRASDYSENTLAKLQVMRDALEERIANHEPLSYDAAVEKVRAFATEREMTEDDLFPVPIDRNAAPVDVMPSWHDEIEETPFSDFCYKDTFGYTFIADLKEQQEAVDSAIRIRLRAIQYEAIERVRAFIKEYNLTKEDIYPPRKVLLPLRPNQRKRA